MAGHWIHSMTKEEDFEYILTAVLGQQADSPMRKSLHRAGIDDVAGIMSLAEQRIERLDYKDDASGKVVITELPASYLQRLIHFKAYTRTKLNAGVMIHRDWKNTVTRKEFEEFQVTGYVNDLATSNLLSVSPSGTRHQDVADIPRIKFQNKGNPKKEKTGTHNNNTMINEEFAFVVNVIMGQNTGSVLHLALRDAGISNVESLVTLSEERIDRIQFRSPSSPGGACR